MATGIVTAYDKMLIGLATEQDRPAIYEMRHAVYACELRQHPTNEAGQLSDALDAFNTYLVAKRGAELVGFISITPPGRTYSVDKYLDTGGIAIPLRRFSFRNTPVDGPPGLPSQRSRRRNCRHARLRRLALDRRQRRRAGRRYRPARGDGPLSQNWPAAAWSPHPGWRCLVRADDCNIRRIAAAGAPLRRPPEILCRADRLAAGGPLRAHAGLCSWRRLLRGDWRGIRPPGSPPGGYQRRRPRRLVPAVPDGRGRIARAFAVAAEYFAAYPRCRSGQGDCRARGTFHRKASWSARVLRALFFRHSVNGFRRGRGYCFSIPPTPNTPTSASWSSAAGSTVSFCPGRVVTAATPLHWRPKSQAGTTW